DEPTRGIDVAARRRIYALIETLAKEGKGIVIVSSDSEELFEICDSIAVISAGRLTAVIDRNESSATPWDEDQIMKASFEGYH
ncbi:MAG: sugar ABC transporter ATP-binding protein, partial [Planctomycetota bacterium]